MPDLEINDVEARLKAIVQTAPDSENVTATFYRTSLGRLITELELARQRRNAEHVEQTRRDIEEIESKLFRPGFVP
jgi:hypothetical protein